MFTHVINIMRVEIVTPAGRKKYLHLLYENLKLQKKDFNQWTIWINTRYTVDYNYCKQLEKENDWIKTIEPILPPNGCKSIYPFFKYACDPSTIYIRIDDDVVWLENNFVKNLVQFRIDNPNYFLVYANIINNSIIDHLHQRIGGLNIRTNIGYDSMDQFGWVNPNIAISKHSNLINSIFKNDLNKFKFNKWILNRYERVSINCISWFGLDFEKFNGSVGEDEEQWLSHYYPKQIEKYNVICGNALCSHFAFFTQRDVLDKTEILKMYRLVLEYNKKLI